MTLEATESIRRFLLHILPSGSVRIRQYGFLANRARGKKLAVCRAWLGAPAPEKVAFIDREERGDECKLCPACKAGYLVLVPLVPRGAPAFALSTIGFFMRFDFEMLVRQQPFLKLRENCIYTRSPNAPPSPQDP